MRPAGQLGALFLSLVTTAAQAAARGTPGVTAWLLEALGFCLFQGKAPENSERKAGIPKDVFGRDGPTDDTKRHPEIKHVKGFLKNSSATYIKDNTIPI